MDSPHRPTRLARHPTPATTGPNAITDRVQSRVRYHGVAIYPVCDAMGIASHHLNTWTPEFGSLAKSVEVCASTNKSRLGSGAPAGGRTP
ncbi:MAG: hypothetical protein QOE48_6314 [Mycobacterium sp.]|jgi:hypothetical protein|nr:hypothetical protein [Mycobacterium sp.]